MGFHLIRIHGSCQILAIPDSFNGLRSNNGNLSGPYNEIPRTKRVIANEPKRKIWMFCGDGEMDEPESLGAISLAAREKLNNLYL